MCLRGRLVKRIVVIVRGESWRCVGGIWIAYGTNVDAGFCLCIAETISFLLLNVKGTNPVL